MRPRRNPRAPLARRREAADKARLRQSPSGVLLITPESLESQFINYDRHLRRLYAHLRFVVIDELHAFLDNVRGIHLRSLLARLAIATEHAPAKIGLSATIGDFAPARTFLCAETPDACILQDQTQRKELRVGLKAYLDNPEAAREPVDGSWHPARRWPRRRRRTTSPDASATAATSSSATAADRPNSCRQAAPS